MAFRARAPRHRAAHRRRAPRDRRGGEHRRANGGTARQHASLLLTGRRRTGTEAGAAGVPARARRHRGGGHALPVHDPRAHEPRRSTASRPRCASAASRAARSATSGLGTHGRERRRSRCSSDAARSRVPDAVDRAGRGKPSWVPEKNGAVLKLVFAVPYTQSAGVDSAKAHCSRACSSGTRARSSGRTQPMCIEWEESSLAFALRDEPVVHAVVSGSCRGTRRTATRAPRSAGRRSPHRGARRSRSIVDRTAPGRRGADPPRLNRSARIGTACAGGAAHKRRGGPPRESRLFVHPAPFAPAASVGVERRVHELDLRQQLLVGDDRVLLLRALDQAVQRLRRRGCSAAIRPRALPPVRTAAASFGSNASDWMIA